MVQVYDVSRQTWATKTMPATRVHASAIRYGDHVLLPARYEAAGGSRKKLQPARNVLCWNIATGEWRELPLRLPEAATLAMPAGRIGDSIYVAGSQEGGQRTRKAWRIRLSRVGSPGAAWRSVEASAHPMGGATMTVCKGKLYLIGGAEKVGPSVFDDQYSDRITCFDPTTGRFTKMKATLPYGIHSLKHPAVHGDTIYLSPGIGPTQANGWGSHGRLVEYDVKADRACESADYPKQEAIWHSDLTCSDDGVVYVFAGWNGDNVAASWRHDPGGKVLKELPRSINGRSLSLCRLPDGKTIVFGTRTGVHSYDRSVVLFDPAEETFTDTGADIPEQFLRSSRFSWPGQGGVVYLANLDSGKVFAFDRAAKRFSVAEFDLPDMEAGVTGQLVQGAYDASSGRVYLLEQRREGDGYVTTLWMSDQTGAK
jgi:WD40 repeat protein